jgi:hypothetical protein
VVCCPAGSTLAGCVGVATYEGLVFEINNRIVHRVLNPTAMQRIQVPPSPTLNLKP